jgi:hypothetical protein
MVLQLVLFRILRVPGFLFQYRTGKDLGNCYFFFGDSIQQEDTFLKRALKGLSTRNEPHAVGPYIDDGSNNRFLEIRFANDAPPCLNYLHPK